MKIFDCEWKKKPCIHVMRVLWAVDDIVLLFTSVALKCVG